MGRFSHLIQKSYNIITLEEAYEQFPLMRDAINETPKNYVYLVVYDQRPMPVPIPPQLIGPYPSIENAKESIKGLEDTHRSNMMYSNSNVLEFPSTGGENDV